MIGGFEILWASNMLLYCFHMLYYNPDWWAKLELLLHRPVQLFSYCRYVCMRHGTCSPMAFHMPVTAA